MEITTIVTDKDGTLYSPAKYVTPLAEFLSRNFDQDKFMRDYDKFREEVIIGRNYNIETMEPDVNGIEMPHAFWVPLFIAIKHGMQRQDIMAEFQGFYPQIFNDDKFPYEPIVNTIFSPDEDIADYSKVLVTNNGRSETLKRMGLENAFDLKLEGAHKRENLDLICHQIENDPIYADPDQTLWIEDDVPLLKRIKNEKKYKTVLRKTKGFKYIPDTELLDFCDLILDDELSTLHWYITQEAQKRDNNNRAHLT